MARSAGSTVSQLHEKFIEASNHLAYVDGALTELVKFKVFYENLVTVSRKHERKDDETMITTMVDDLDKRIKVLMRKRVKARKLAETAKQAFITAELQVLSGGDV